jgi:hypothetical protein
MPLFVLGDIAACGHPSCPFSLGRVKKLIQLRGWLLDKTQKTPETVLYPVNDYDLMTGLGRGCKSDEPPTFQA